MNRTSAGPEPSTMMGFVALAECAPEIVWTARADGRRDFCNRRWAQFTGLSPESGLGFGWLESIHPDDRAGALRAWEAAREAGDYEEEYRIRRFDGTYRWMLVRGSPYRDELGEILAWVGIATDIESLRRVEQAARESEAAFRAFAEAIPDMAWITTAGGVLEWCNSRWHDYIGKPLNELHATRWLGVIHPDDLERVLARWEQAVTTGQAYEAEVRLCGPDGVFRWFLARGAPLRDSGGRIIRWYGTTTDIELQKRTGLELSLLAKIGNIVANAKDATATLQRLTEASVGAFCDLCSVTLLEDDDLTLHRATAAFSDHRASEFFQAERLLAMPAASRWDSPNRRALRGESVLESEVTAAWIDSISTNAEHARVIRELRLVSLITVPVDVEGKTRGSLTFCTTAHSGRRYGERDLLLAQELGRRVGMVLAIAQSYERERRVAITLQRALLPHSLPSLPGLRFDAVYVPGSDEADLGGDWYDAFVLPDGRVGITIGDICGRGLAAAVAMGRLRQAMQTAAFIKPDPVTMLAVADLTLRSANPSGIATAFCAIFSPADAMLSYASAGHPLPLLRRPDGTIDELRASGTLLGVNARTPRGARVVELPPGAFVVFYTDGLIEGTRNVLAGEARLHAALESSSCISAERPARAVYDAVLDSASGDDVAVLTLQIGAALVESDPRLEEKG